MVSPSELSSSIALGNATISSTLIILRTVDHSRLKFSSATSILVFYRLQDQYSREVFQYARQTVAENIATSKAIPSRHPKFCVDAELSESFKRLRILEDFNSYDSLIDDQMKSCLNRKTEK